jgi:hypothetical protein
MKKYSVLVAVFLFSCTSEIESPDSILQRYLNLDYSSNKAYEVITNGSFDTDEKDKITGESVWGTYSHNDGTIYRDGNYNIVFTPSTKDTADWHLQLIQRRVNIKPGYSYKLDFSGNTLDDGNAQVAFVLMNCITETKCNDYKKWVVFLTSKTEVEINPEDVWKNCDIKNGFATFVISGGNSKIKFQINRVSIWAEPIDCSNSL